MQMQNSHRKVTPSSDLLASIHTVEIDRGTHREKRPFGVYHSDGRRVAPGDRFNERMESVYLAKHKIEAAGADPQRCFVLVISEDCPVPLEPGRLGFFEHVGPGRARFLGPVEDFSAHSVN